VAVAAAMLIAWNMSRVGWKSFAADEPEIKLDAKPSLST